MQTSADPEAPGGRSGCDVAVAAVDEVDVYSSLVAGVRLEAVRTGLGIGPHRVLSVRDDRFLFTSNDIGFPFRSTTTIGDEQVAVATSREWRVRPQPGSASSVVIVAGIVPNLDSPVSYCRNTRLGRVTAGL